MSDLRIVMADDHASVRESLARYLNGEPGLSVVGEASDGHEALRMVSLLAPDVLLLDLSMPNLSGLEVLQRLRNQEGAPRVLVLSMHNTQAYVQAALRQGAAGYVTKEASASEVVRNLRAVCEAPAPQVARLSAETRRRPVPVGSDTIDPAQAREALGLSARELEVLALIAHGFTSKEMAARLDVAKATVDTYRVRLAEKLCVRGRAELVRIAVRAGLLSLPDSS